MNTELIYKQSVLTAFCKDHFGQVTQFKLYSKSKQAQKKKKAQNILIERIVPNYHLEFRAKTNMPQYDSE